MRKVGSLPTGKRWNYKECKKMGLLNRVALTFLLSFSIVYAEDSKTGTLSITADIGNAMIYIDGEPSAKKKPVLVKTKRALFVPSNYQSLKNLVIRTSNIKPTNEVKKANPFDSAKLYNNLKNIIKFS